MLKCEMLKFIYFIPGKVYLDVIYEVKKDHIPISAFDVDKSLNAYKTLKKYDFTVKTCLVNLVKYNRLIKSLSE